LQVERTITVKKMSIKLGITERFPVRIMPRKFIDVFLMFLVGEKKGAYRFFPT